VILFASGLTHVAPDRGERARLESTLGRDLSPPMMLQKVARLPRWFSTEFFQRSRWTGYAMAVVLIGLSIWAHILLEPVIHGEIPFALFFVAVALTAWFGGYGPCLLAVALGAITVWYFVLEPRFSFVLTEPFQVLGLAAFVFTGLVIAGFSGRIREALRETDVARRESDERAHQAEQLAEALHESERRFRGFAEHTTNVLWIIRGDRDELVYINPAFSSVYGRSSDGLYQDFSLLTEYLHEDDRARARSFWDKCRAGLTVEEFRIVRPDGSMAWIRRRGFPIPNDRGQVEYRGGISEDITEEKNLQQERDRLLDSERSARQAAERIGRLKDEFLATLSHELRSPLNAILGWIQVLKMRSPAPEMLSQAVLAIERSGQAQARLIEDLLDMSRIVSGKFRLEVQTVDLASLIQTTVESFIPGAQAKDIRLEQILDPLVGQVKGDPDRLQQVVWNLLSNAIKFTDKGGKIQVSLQRVNSHCEIRVADTGRGIKPDFLPFVFDRFRQQDATTTRAQGGLGLGLAIVKQLVEYHGGSVAVESRGDGLGTVFFVRLPIPVVSDETVEKSLPTTPSASDFSLSLEGFRVLVVDDDPEACIVLRRILEEQNAIVDTASSVAVALEIIDTRTPDLLISDIGMPGQDGYQFIAQVRKLEGPVHGIPAIALTAFSRHEDRISALHAGFNMHVAKPVNALELLTVISTLRSGLRR